MKQLTKDENEKYRVKIKKYRIHFGLAQSDIANILKWDVARYGGIESGRRTLDINAADCIANVYGLKYYQVGNESTSIPEFAALPKATQSVIVEREKIGIKPKNSDRHLGFYLDQLIKDGVLNTPISAKDVMSHLPPDVQSGLLSMEITSLFNKSPRNKHIVKVGKKGKEHLFQLKEFAKSI